MKKISTKITAFIVIAILICACDAVKRVPDGKLLLTKNEIEANGKSIKEETIFNQLYQKPNSTLLGYRLRLNLYNLANLNPDSTYQAKFANNPEKYKRQSKWLSEKQVNRLGKSFLYYGIHNFLKKTGEPPVIIDKERADKSVLRLKYYYFNNGYFNVNANYNIDTLSLKKAKIKYAITPGNAFFLDTLKTTILTPALDSLYQTNKSNTFLKSGNQYKTEDFENEKNRITTHFRNNGAYYFQSNYVTFDIDTIKKVNQANINLVINNYSYQDQDSSKTVPFKIYKISDVNIYTDYSSENNNRTITDSTTYKNFNLYSHQKLKYKPRAITNAIFITKGGLYADYKTVLTTRYLNNLKVFNYPSIQYEVDKRDSTAQSLIAKVYLTPRKKYSFGTTLDVTHSNIQDFGIGLSVSETIRNVFNGAETLEIAARGNIGSSQDLANPNNNFFNVSEYGLDLKLNIPRIFIPFSTEKIIPKSMIPSTLITVGFAKQRNLGLDKENFTGALSYNWTPKRNHTARFDLFNTQFVRNLNPNNYFFVYNSSYRALNAIGKQYNTNPNYYNNDIDRDLVIERGTTGFTRDVLSGNASFLKPLESADIESVKSIEERRLRLTENDFILATSFTFSKTTKKDLLDNDFYLFRTKIESAGTLLSAFAKTTNQKENVTGNYEIFNLEYSEYLKTEFEYIKHWDLSKEKIFAFRSFFGIAVPFGNSNYIPFSRSYFSGGSNDNRAWQPYSLGPGSSGAVDDFNEANMKIAISGEFRFKILGNLKGALFADAGNIWNVLDNVVDEKSTFTSFSDLKDIALGTGFGLRYDLSFFVIRFDLGFKTYNPANETRKRWFQEYNFGNSVLNFGINYPF
ncbi:outer membrane protein assembly factor [Flavobacterium sp. GSP27]|uniref:Outer membrane protein assembly factor n=1 Tax=Flavobacterium bomense TaxID=2497483 RepID=A0A432CLT7_9FLAO|nr:MULTISPECIES: BamA/TamA family outer membrane protein [Flavobacterium]RTY93552.1 outer membrane protein assembly factor [Flavobacterium sp. GSN2]RTY82793.1 outer membrane protein assembly factor [Flavobacterium sp. ZB4P23]RTY89772.1 outer membrane protein assembly factor [Flavobacterium sp. RSP46]RTZ04321.1 outer membrane protein assembly factor [Flavobacterium bomense]RTZ08318.1 outer membrane protein assembly factor [Flavobacterium sp. GSP27]